MSGRALAALLTRRSQVGLLPGPPRNRNKLRILSSTLDLSCLKPIALYIKGPSVRFGHQRRWVVIPGTALTGTIGLSPKQPFGD